MRVIPVLDIRAGVVVRADGGDRARYRPVQSSLVSGAGAVSLACAFRDGLGLSLVYFADLDAIASRGVELDQAVAVTQALRKEGLSSWVDAGVSASTGVRALLRAGATAVVIGLETLTTERSMNRLPRSFRSERLVFSLDVRGERTLTDADGVADLPPTEVGRRAFEAGFSTILVLDLDRVGSGAGLPIERLRRLREAVPGARWVAGGGARDSKDLERLARIGYEGCLVASALHDGRIGRAEIARLRGSVQLETASSRSSQVETGSSL